MIANDWMHDNWANLKGSTAESAEGYREGKPHTPQEGGENEVRPLVLLWLNIDISSKLLDYHLRDCEAKTHPAAVAVLRLREASEELEQLGESLGRHPDSSIIDRAR